MKLAFWIVFAAGFLACSTLGIGPVLRRMAGDWTSAPMLAGIAFGVALVAVALAFLTGVRPGPLASDAAMLGALVALIAAKVAVGVLAMSGVLGRG